MPKEKFVLEDIDYRLGQATSVDVTVNVGQFQDGAPVADWGDEFVTMRPGETYVFENGGNELVGEKLPIVTTVKDVRPETNSTSVTVTLDDGNNRKVHTFKAEAPADKGFVIYDLLITFKE